MGGRGERFELRDALEPAQAGQADIQQDYFGRVIIAEPAQGILVGDDELSLGLLRLFLLRLLLLVQGEATVQAIQCLWYVLLAVGAMNVLLKIIQNIYLYLM